MDIEYSQPISKNNKLIDGKYVIDLNQRLGGGSYSQVYSGWLKANPNQQYACKVISKPDLQKQKIAKKKTNQAQKLKLKVYITKRIKSQVQIGHKIVHPNIVQFLYYSQTLNNIYIFMQKCQINLEQLIQKKGNLPEKDALKYFRDIVNAACVLYDYNITHRDIKAQNILIKDGVAKLADFGFAKELREKDVQEDGTGVGTILYMAPQLILQDKPQYSIRCDVWSIGVVMYYVLFGNVPWQTNQTIQSFQLSLKKPIAFSPAIQVSLKIKNLISRMLMYKDEQRINIKDVKMIIDQLIFNY